MAVEEPRGPGLGPLAQERIVPPPRRGRRWIGALVLVALAVVPLVLVLRAQHQARLRADAARDRRLAAAEVVRLRRVQAPRRGAARALLPGTGATAAERLRARRSLVGAVRASILRDARARVAAGEIEGPIAAVTCGTIARDPDAIPDDRVLARPVGRYDCLAVRRSAATASGRSVDLGYPFVAALDFTRFTYVWCRNTPPQGERGVVLAQIRLDRACLAARGRALGTGYAAVPGD